MNVRELMAKLDRMDPELPVVFEQEDLDLVGQYVEVMDAQFTDDDVYFDAKAFSLDGSRPYDRRDWHNTGTPERKRAAEPVVLLSCKLPYRSTIDGEIASAELPAGNA
jgi:hypothetical protein